MTKDKIKDSFEPSVLTIFGITGDLASRKLLPSLYHLAEDGLLPEGMRIVGISRSEVTVDQLINNIKESVIACGGECKDETLQKLSSIIRLTRMDLTKPDDYSRLKSELDAIEDEVGQCLHRLFYLSIPAKTFQPTIQQLGEHQLNAGCTHGETESRLLIEKPFGRDMQSARELIGVLRQSFEENQIYRIDHYLAKETVQNILHFRFENPLFNSSWDARHISHIMITAAEEIGIEGRVDFYEQSGAMRDVVQSHLLQILALITMDEPPRMNSANIHEAKEKVFAAMKPPLTNMLGKHTVRGQYHGYRGEVDNPDSQTETFAAICLIVDNDRWKDVPMFIRTGKAMETKVTEATIVFKDPLDPSCTNTLTIRIQPHEGIVLDLRIKKPGFTSGEVEHTQMSFCYGEELDVEHPNAYERVIIDAMRGDQTLFATSAEILDGWRVVEPIIDAWDKGAVPLERYDEGSWGPASADAILGIVDAQWLTSTAYVCTAHLNQSAESSQTK